MAKTTSAFDDLLTIQTRAELRAALSRIHLPLSLPQAHQLASHAADLEPTPDTLRLGIIHTYTSDLLDPWLGLAAALHGLVLHSYHAPYGFTLQEAQAGSGLVRHQPDLTLLMLRRQDLHPDLTRPLPALNSGELEALAKEIVERLSRLIHALRAHKVGQFVLTVLPSLDSPGLGIYDAQSEFSESTSWAGIKAEIGRCVRESLPSTLFLDLDEMLQQMGRERFFDRRYWYSAQFPFAADAAREFSRRVVTVGAVVKQPKAKVLVLDADNTLWGGIIGEDGIDGIALGPEYPGNAYVDFQRRILDYRRRGFILALCSKNNPADVDQVLKEHPHQLLRDEHFAARRINWLPKADNLASLAEELNLGLDSFVFVDDSDHECAAVRHKLPQVEVVQTPTRPVDVPRCLDHVARLEVLSLTAEDLAKSELYAQERKRRELSAEVDKSGGNLDEYLAMLGMKMRVSLDAPGHVARVSQLTQKTNQFNLTTRRYGEHEIQEFVRHPDWIVADFSLTDVFGDSGIVGVALIRMASPHQAMLDTFLMSCRVIGREAEAAFLHALLRVLARRGVRELLAEYKPTPKNVLVKDFLPDQGFERHADGGYRRDLHDAPPQPEASFPIAVQFLEEDRDAPLAA